MYLLNNDVLKHIRLLAIHNVNCHSIEWYTELAYRHYSKTYHTPLHMAKQLVNPAEIIRIFMEDEMLNMEAEDVKAIREKLVKARTPFLHVEDYQPEDVSEMDDEEWVMQQLAEAAAREKEGDKKPKSAGPSMADAATMAQKAIQNLYNKIDKPVPNDDGDMKFPKED